MTQMGFFLCIYIYITVIVLYYHYYYYYIQDIAHNNNFDNIFISLGFSHKLTVFYDKNNPAECNEQH